MWGRERKRENEGGGASRKNERGKDRGQEGEKEIRTENAAGQLLEHKLLKQLVQNVQPACPAHKCCRASCAHTRTHFQ